MKINILLAAAFLSIVIYANIDEEHGIVGLTKLDGGVGCVCHDINLTSSVTVWIEGPDSVLRNSTALFKLLMTGGPAVAGGFNLATYFGELDSADTSTKVLFGQLTHTSPNPFQNDTVSWSFYYSAPDSLVSDTIYSVANSVNDDGIPSNLDQWNFGENFAVRIFDDPVPVELSNFVVTVNLNNVQISWTTLTETNNSGFDIERKTESSDWLEITFVPGFGTSTESHSYIYNDNQLQDGSYSYRLKQINLDGSVVYSDIVNIEVSIPSEFTLEQNYPNPFNPSTNIGFRVAEFGFVSLKVYDALGNLVATLADEQKPAGEYDVEFNAQGFTSGIYFYKLETEFFNATKKMILLK
ncbi:MAG TPA: choice-of-anchor V domain-containing protein [Ignavibacteriaceae bacterium]